MPKMESKLTIILPTYNRPDYLRETLVSIFNNDYKEDYSLVLCDNGSTVAGYKIIREFLSGYPNARYIRFEKTLPLFENWNRCVDLARQSKYLAMYHDDDVYESQIIRKEIEFFESHPRVGMVVTGARFIDQDGKVIGERAPMNIPPVTPGRDYIQLRLHDRNFISNTPSAMYRVAALGQQPFHPLATPMSGEYPAWLTIAENWDMGYISEKLLRYRRHSKQGSSPLVSQNENNVVSGCNNLILYTNEYLSRYPEDYKKVKEWKFVVTKRYTLDMLRMILLKIEEGKDIQTCVAALFQMKEKPKWVYRILQLLIIKLAKPWNAKLIRKTLGGISRSLPAKL